jgi:hypothetical protein
MVSEDDFSATGTIDYKPPAVGGKETNLQEFAKNLQKIEKIIAEASKKRDSAKNIQT